MNRIYHFSLFDYLEACGLLSGRRMTTVRIDIVLKKKI